MDGRLLRAQRAKRARREAWKHRWDFWKRIAFYERHLKSVRELSRALEAGYAGTMEPGTALQVESLESVMRAITFADRHIKLHRAALGPDVEF